MNYCRVSLSPPEQPLEVVVIGSVFREEFAAKINDHLAKGWRLIGSMVVSPSGTSNCTLYTQMMGLYQVHKHVDMGPR